MSARPVTGLDGIARGNVPSAVEMGDYSPIQDVSSCSSLTGGSSFLSSRPSQLSGLPDFGVDPFLRDGENLSREVFQLVKRRRRVINFERRGGM